MLWGIRLELQRQDSLLGVGMQLLMFWIGCWHFISSTIMLDSGFQVYVLKHTGTEEAGFSRLHRMVYTFDDIGPLRVDKPAARAWFRVRL